MEPQLPKPSTDLLAPYPPAEQNSSTRDLLETAGLRSNVDNLALRENIEKLDTMLSSMTRILESIKLKMHTSDATQLIASQSWSSIVTRPRSRTNEQSTVSLAFNSRRAAPHEETFPTVK